MQTTLFIRDHQARIVKTNRTEENHEIDQDLGKKMNPGLATVVLQGTWTIGTGIIITTEKKEDFLQFPLPLQHLELSTEISATEEINPLGIIEIGKEEDNIVAMINLGEEELPIPSVFLLPIIEILLTVDRREATASRNIASLSLLPATLSPRDPRTSRSRRRVVV